MSALNPGLPLLGKQLPTIPPNSTNEEQIGALNSVIDKLNNNNQEIVGSGTALFTYDSSLQTFLTIPHNLGYAPRAYVYLNGVTISTSGGTSGSIIHTNTNISLPTYLSATGIGVGGGGGTPSIAFGRWLDFFLDTTNLYIHLINADSVTGSVNIRYTLTRDTSV